MDPFWLTEEQFAKIAPHLPTHTRGKPRVDDRRVISGIIQVLKSGGRWVDAPAVYGPKKTLYNRFVRWATKGVWMVPHSGPGRRPTRSRADRLLCREGAPLRIRRERGEQSQAMGRSRGGRSTKIHALSDRQCRPIAFLLTGGQVADGEAAKALLNHLPPSARGLHGDKGYDTNPVRHRVEDNGTWPNIPPKANRVWKNCFSPVLYRARNAIERMVCRLKDFRRIATRYDRLATNYLAAVCLDAAVSYWL